MAIRIEIGLRRGVRDPRGEGVVARARKFLHLPVRGCATRDVYKIAADLPPRAASAVRRALTDAVLARSAFDRLPPPARYDWLVEVGFRPGVTDNVGRTARVIVQDLAGRPLGEREEVHTATEYFVRGGLTRASCTRRCTRGTGTCSSAPSTSPGMGASQRSRR